MRTGRDERGATLILALIFIVAIGLIVGALTDWAMNDLNNSVKFKSASALDYSATSTVEVAVQSIRYTPLYTTTQSPNLGYCWTPPSGYVSQLPPVNGYTVAVWCSTVQNLASPDTRIVSFYACQSTLTSSSSQAAVTAAGASCEGTPLLYAVVVFDDYPPGGSAPLTQTCTTTCGQAASTAKWVWG